MNKCIFYFTNPVILLKQKGDSFSLFIPYATFREKSTTKQTSQPA
jgi:uncharacterized membrane protein YobD (UPF0266 family)